MFVTVNCVFVEFLISNKQVLHKALDHRNKTLVTQDKMFFREWKIKFVIRIRFTGQVCSWKPQQQSWTKIGRQHLAIVYSRWKIDAYINICDKPQCTVCLLVKSVCVHYKQEYNIAKPVMSDFIWIWGFKHCRWHMQRFLFSLSLSGTNIKY